MPDQGRGVLSNVGAEVWQGPSLQAYIANQLRMAEWLDRTSADSAAGGQQLPGPQPLASVEFGGEPGRSASLDT